MVVRLFYPWVGGMERQAHKLASRLSARGISVQLVTGWWFWGTPRRETIDNVPVFRNFTLWNCFGIKGLRKFGGYLYILSLIFYLWRHRSEYDLIHVHGFSYHTFAAVLAARWCRRPVISKLANSGPASDLVKMRSNKHLALSRYMLPTALSCDRFVALNKLVEKELGQAGVSTAKILRIPNGVLCDGIKRKSDYRLHRPARLLFVGRLHEQKGLDVLLAAVQHLRGQRCPADLHLTLVGDGPLKTQLLQLVRRLGSSASVEFAGQSCDVLRHFREADIFVLPSRAEGVSNALLEAMVLGLPIVASNIPGNAEIIEHGKNGLLFALDDVDSLAAALRQFLTSTDARETLGKSARRDVESQYSIDQIAERYIAAYESVLLEAMTASRVQGRLSKTSRRFPNLSER